MRDRIAFEYLYVAGLLTGIIAMILGKSALLGHSGLWSEGIMLQIAAMNLTGNALFLYLLGRRGLRFVLLSIMATTYLGIVLSMVVAFWYGLACGCLLAAGVLRYGLKGILLMLAGILPQGLIYAPLAYGLLNWCVITCNMIYRKEMYKKDINTKDKYTKGIYAKGIHANDKYAKGIHVNDVYTKGIKDIYKKDMNTKDMYMVGDIKTPAMARRVFSWLLLFGALAAGCALESFVNPLLLKAAARLVV